MEAGVCRQVGKPVDVYNRPVDAFVAQFLGKANLLPGRVVGLGDDVLVMVRPENVIIRPSRGASGSASPSGRGRPEGPGEGRTLDVMVVKTTFEGALVQYLLQIDGMFITARLFHYGVATFKPGDSVSVSFPSDRYHLLPKS
jgi:ABC-type Fe3+/spermidine/putrescine transport system ATPase subunit